MITALPEITEIKETLAGERRTFRCRVLSRGPGSLVVLFVSEHPFRVADLALPPGTITFGYFWADRGYNVYHWMSPEGGTLGYYVNLSDRTTLGEHELSWRDLALDVLLRADGRAQLLDVEDLPRSLDAATREAIGQTMNEVITRAPVLRAEIETQTRALWPLAFGAPRP